MSSRCARLSETRGNEHAQKSSRNGLTSDSSDAMACAASPFLPAPAASAVASAGVVTGRPVLYCDGAVGAETGAGSAPGEEEDAGADVATERSGMTNEPSCMRSGPENEPDGVLLSHSHESNDETGGRGGGGGGMLDEPDGSANGEGRRIPGVVDDEEGKVEARARVEDGFVTMCERELGEWRGGMMGERRCPPELDAGEGAPCACGLAALKPTRRMTSTRSAWRRAGWSGLGEMPVRKAAPSSSRHGSFCPVASG